MRSWAKPVYHGVSLGILQQVFKQWSISEQCRLCVFYLLFLCAMASFNAKIFFVSGQTVSCEKSFGCGPFLCVVGQVWVARQV